ncbi:MAG: cytochrome c biogenesis protein/redoxin, partial [Proteobacteria bacterium]|nr:cytochrome c biogenesis protein/redoxin [Pseudomonadota bacterium]
MNKVIFSTINLNIMDSWTIYFAGILSFFSPCVLPIIPVYFSILLQDKDSIQPLGGESIPMWKTLLPKGLLFCLGFSIIFSILGFGAGKIGSLIVLHRGAISLLAGVIILIIALKLLDFIYIPLLDRAYSININRLKTRFSLLNALILVVLFAATWSPCIGPVLGGILTYISVRTFSPISSAFKLFLFGLGISTPLIIFTLFFRPLMNFIQRNRYFILILQKALGIILVFFAINLFTEVSTMADRPKIPSVADKIIVPDKLPLFVSMISMDCETCQEMFPTIKKLKDNCDGKTIEFRTIDVEDPEYSYAVYKLGMIGTPTYVMIDVSGKEVQR